MEGNMVLNLSVFGWQLGATLANSQRSEEALPAYQRALALKPKYARAWLNMGKPPPRTSL
jgi:tetratricopeptide (TPR) repeat protein